MLLLLLWLPLSWVTAISWQENLRPKLFCSMSSRDYTAFIGNLSSPDHFTVMHYTEDPNLASPSINTPLSSPSPPSPSGLLLLGARNLVYKLSSSDLRLTQTLVWPASPADRSTCHVKGKSQDACNNFIVVIQQFSSDPTRYMFCGTNAFAPLCREYMDERGSYIERSQRNGIGLAPFDPDHNSTATLVDDHLYSGTVADFTGVDSIIFRKPLRTQQYDSVQLNSPDFVGSFAHEDYVYFFFREAAVEFINCGKSIFSRVARVCKNDEGGPHKAKTSWTSFLKTRLNCSVPGEYPFYFDEIQDVTQLVSGTYGGKPTTDYVIYATFSTPVNSIGGSAVCAFRLRDISDAFSGKFKEQRSMSANWLSVEDHKVPSPRPGTCMNNTRSLPNSNLNFIKTHSLMDDPVKPFFGAPIVIRTGIMSKFTVLAVDPQVKTTDGTAFDVLFIGSTNGRIIKAINSRSATHDEGVQTVIIEELQVFSSHTVIKSLTVMNNGREGQKSLGQLAVMSQGEVRAFPVQRCDRATSCVHCVALQDPYCAWEIRSARCSSGDWTPNMASSFLQSVSKGIHDKCPGASKTLLGFPLGEEKQVFSYEQQFGDYKLGQVVNIIDENTFESEDSDLTSSGNRGPGVKVMESPPQQFSLEMLLITVSAGAVAALVLGFVTGYCCGRKCRKEESGHVPYPDTEYEYFEQRGGLARPVLGPGAPLLPTQKLNDGRQDEVTYAEPDLLSSGLRSGPSSHLHLSGNAPGSLVLGTGGGQLQQTPRFPPMSGQRQEQPNYSSSLLNANKFNTIHGNKRPLPSINHYESAAEARLGSGKDPSYYARGRDNFNSYHMSTLGRSSSMRGKSEEGRQGSNGSSDSSCGGKGQQVVDSAYGTTTRSVKKVYL